MLPPSPPASPFLNLQSWDPDPSMSDHTPPTFAHYRASPAFTFHAYSPPASPSPQSHPEPEHDDVAPPALSTKRASRLSAPFPTFLYASEPPPVTARNKQRVRPSPSQLADLKALYAVTAHPTRDEREALGRRIGMRYQSVTNWFQNQRSTAKKRGGSATVPVPQEHTRAKPLPDPPQDRSPSPHHHPMRPATPPSPPPPVPARRPRIDPVRDIIAAQQRHPPQHAHTPPPFTLEHVIDFPASAPSPGPALPLPLSGSAIVPSFPVPSESSVGREGADGGVRAEREANAEREENVEGQSHGGGANAESQSHRGKRSRPSPQQLATLRAVHARTASPSIEERTRVGKEIGMELAKVTNWFRNLRQTARKKERRAVELAEPHKRTRDDDNDDGARKRARRWLLDDEDTSTAFDTNSTVGSLDCDEGMDVDDDYVRRGSELGTESDAAHEAVTPEPHPLPTPTASTSRGSTSPAHPMSAAKDGGTASVDDAMLLLAFHSAH